MIRHSDFVIQFLRSRYCRDDFFGGVGQVGGGFHDQLALTVEEPQEELAFVGGRGRGLRRFELHGARLSHLRLG